VALHVQVAQPLQPRGDELGHLRGEDGEDAGKVVGRPVAGHVGLAEADQTALPDSGEERVRSDEAQHRGVGAARSPDHCRGGETGGGLDADVQPARYTAEQRLRHARPEPGGGLGRNVGPVLRVDGDGAVDGTAVVWGGPGAVGAGLACQRSMSSVTAHLFADSGGDG